MSIMTRERLPDITQPLEILTDDLPSAGQKATAPREAARAALTPETLAAMAPAPEPAPAPDDAALAGQRQQARQLFEAKAMDYDPKRPFYITLGALALAAAGYGGYLWWQLQPKAPVVNAQALRKHSPAQGARRHPPRRRSAQGQCRPPRHRSRPRRRTLCRLNCPPRRPKRRPARRYPSASV